MPRFVRFCAAMGWDQSYTPLTRPRLNPPPGRWPPAGVSDKLLTSAGSHNIARKLHAITKDFQSSREAPKPHLLTFATLPSENLDVHQKSYFYLHRGGSQSPWIPPPWGLPKSWKFKEISFGSTLGRRSRSEAVFEGTRSTLERPRVTKGGHPRGSGTHFGAFWVDFGAVWGGPKCSATRPCRCAEHFC